MGDLWRTKGPDTNWAGLQWQPSQGTRTVYSKCRNLSKFGKRWRRRDREHMTELRHFKKGQRRQFFSSALVRAHLVLPLYYKTDRNILEEVQWERATRMVRDLKNVLYKAIWQRSLVQREMELFSLKQWWWRADLIAVYNYPVWAEKVTATVWHMENCDCT